MRDIIRPLVNKQIIVTLDEWPATPQQSSKTGNVDYRLALNNDTALIYLPAAAYRQLETLHPQAGDEIAITNAGKGTWVMELVQDETRPTPAPPPQPQPVRTAPPQASATAPTTDIGSRAHLDRTAPAPIPIQRDETAPAPNGTKAAAALGQDRTLDLIRAAIDVCAVTEKHARERGLTFVFSAADVLTVSQQIYMHATRAQEILHQRIAQQQRAGAVQ